MQLFYKLYIWTHLRQIGPVPTWGTITQGRSTNSISPSSMSRSATITLRNTENIYLANKKHCNKKNNRKNITWQLLKDQLNKANFTWNLNFRINLKQIPEWYRELVLNLSEKGNHYQNLVWNVSTFTFRNHTPAVTFWHDYSYAWLCFFTFSLHHPLPVIHHCCCLHYYNLIKSFKLGEIKLASTFSLGFNFV